MVTQVDTRRLPVPARAIDIGEWLFSLSDAEYRATAKPHVGSGHYETPDGRRGIVDVEAFAAAFIVNHHVEEEARRDYVRVRSPESHAWFLRVIPLRLDVRWEMLVHPVGDDQCDVECRLSMGLPHRGLERAARMLGVPILQRRHLREQMTGFVLDILAKYR